MTDAPASSPKKNILLCGHRSFVSKGLETVLAREGHRVTCFTRGPVAREEADGIATVTGPVQTIDENPLLDETYDTVINFILLKDGTQEDNIAFIEALLRLVSAKKVSHLVHISSVSVYKADIPLISEDAEVEEDPSKKGAYGALKVVQDNAVKAGIPAGVALSLVRPGFVLGEGLADPIVGTALRAQGNRLLALGNAKNHFPLISREQVQEALARIVANPPAPGTPDVTLLVDKNSPTRREYLNAVCRVAGAGAGVVTAPVPLWLAAGAGGEALTRALGKGQMMVFQKIQALCRQQGFDSNETERKLGMSLSFPWRQQLKMSLDSQRPNFRLPYEPQPLKAFKSPDKDTVALIGFGRIVKQKHLPALNALDFDGQVLGYDLRAYEDESGHAVRKIGDGALPPANLYVIATPGPAHKDAPALLKHVDVPVLVEKPLCYRKDELEAWKAFSESRTAPVFLCHNYRYKANVQKMLRFLKRYNPGPLLNVALHFNSLPVSNETAVWLRDERRARTLLVDYSIHFLDLACLFAGAQPWTVESVRHELNSGGQTAMIDGRISCPNYSVNFVLRQGFMPRKARLLFTFQNYALSLGFFPDTFTPHVAHDNFGAYIGEAKESGFKTLVKIADKLTGRDTDLSHAYAYAAALNPDDPLGNTIRLKSLLPFYEMLTELGSRVYGD